MDTIMTLKDTTLADLASKVTIQKFIVTIFIVLSLTIGTVYGFSVWKGSVDTKIVYIESNISDATKTNESINAQLIMMNKQFADMNSSLNSRMGKIEGKLEYIKK